MHKLTDKPITLDCFEIDDFVNIEYPEDKQRAELNYPIDKDFIQMCLIPYLEYLRQTYVSMQKELKENYSEELEKEAKIIWKELVRWLPNGWLQTRTVTMNYENLLSMCKQRKHHKLTEWSEEKEEEFDFELKSFIEFAKSLPYSEEFIFVN